MTYETLAASLQSAIARQDETAIAEVVTEMNAADLADFIQQPEQDERPDLDIRLLMLMPIERRAETFGYMPLEVQQSLAPRMSPEQLAELVTAMPADERADLFNVLDETVRHNLFKRLAREEREDLRRLASYQEGTAGAIMTSDYAVIPANTSVAQALGVLRNTAPDKETIYQCYVVDSEHHLLGTISLRELIIAPPGSTVEELMIREMVKATVDMPQETVARQIARYDLMALPIVDANDKLVGIVTYDDAMDVVEAEATEDIHKGANVGKLDKPLGRATPLTLYRSRVYWLVMLVFANILTGAGIAYFEQTIADHLALLFFMPLLVASAGNAGAQASTLMVRGLATGEISVHDWGRLLGKEVLVAGALGLTMAVAVMLIGLLRTGPDVALVVALTMVIVVLVGSLVGMVLPFLLDRLNIDPASASAPLITTIADVCGVMVYFSIASWMLDLP